MLTFIAGWRWRLVVGVPILILCLLPAHLLPTVAGGEATLNYFGRIVRAFFAWFPAPAQATHHAPHLDKIAHAIFMLSWSLSAFFDNRRRLKKGARSDARVPLWRDTLIYPVIFGGAIEILQHLCTTTRTADWGDFFADALGAATGFIICHLAGRPHRQVNQEPEICPRINAN
ncbi:MAG: VanZ family protein [Planctomycetota bacterium]|jgi:VanZ family protein|nr:VanZ family protein [Planctomycetota bacterium]